MTRPSNHRLASLLGGLLTAACGGPNPIATSGVDDTGSTSSTPPGTGSSGSADVTSTDTSTGGERSRGTEPGGSTTGTTAASDSGESECAPDGACGLAAPEGGSGR